METQFQHWTARVTDGTGDLFWIMDDVLISKDRGYFFLSMFDEAIDDFQLEQVFSTKTGWKIAYRLARVVRKSKRGK